ncbi:MAG: SIS domain-containing protein [Lachnospiraceae bacterium]|nr:SIS domain-containing protein [Lachnospiraceae bacterium]
MEKYVDDLVQRYPLLAVNRPEILDAYGILKDCYENGGKLLVAGNGGSASDSEHIAGELMKRFKVPRPIAGELAERIKMIDPERGSKLAGCLEQPLTVIPFTAQGALATAYINDVGAEGIFAQQLLGYGRAGDVFLGISTSGNSPNILAAAIVARAMDIKVVGLTGKTGGKLADMSDVAVRVPEVETYKVQELHLPVYHCWCMMLEEHFYG